eukprot:4726228-Pyramimonas_sp.AAC.1
MFGSKKSPVIKIKAGETKSLFKWVCTEGLPKHADHISKGKELLECACALYEWDEYLSDLDHDPDARECKRLEDLALKHLNLLAMAE